MRKRIPVPEDWNEETDGYTVLLACIPNSPDWRSIYSGAFYELSFWAKWDPQTGDTLAARDLGKQVWEGLCMANCADLLTQLTRIADALETLGGGVTNPGSVANVLDDIKEHLDQLEEIQNNQTEIFGGTTVTVAPGGP